MSLASDPPGGLFDGMLDDAAMFPPGDLPLDRAVPAHVTHHRSAYGALVGPLVVAASALDELARVTASLPPGSLEVALTAPVPRLAEALAAARAVPSIRVVAAEVSLPDGMSVAEAIDAVGRHTDGDRSARATDDVLRIFVELPRDERREPLLGAVARAGCAAKMRTGGLTPDAYPREDELASAVVAAVRAGVPFKATAGLHHAVRNADAGTGFEQHGFLNLLLATAAARRGADTPDVSRLLTERDPERVVAGVRTMDATVRESFLSFGTCSIVEPVEELAALGLHPRVAEASV